MTQRQVKIEYRWMKLARRIKNGVTVLCNSSIRSGTCTTGQTVGIMSLDLVIKLLHCTGRIGFAGGGREETRSSTHVNGSAVKGTHE
jgi:hypothetical protein